mgnify:CR=1 FL=1
MAAFTDFAENKLIAWRFRGQALGIGDASAAAGSGPTKLYIGLLTVAPTDGAPGTEVSVAGYGRVEVPCTMDAWAGTQGEGTTVASSGSSGTTSNNSAINFPTPSPDGWGEVKAMGIWDAATGGNLVIYSALAVAKVINQGDTVPFPAASLTFQLDN